MDEGFTSPRVWKEKAQADVKKQSLCTATEEIDAKINIP